MLSLNNIKPTSGSRKTSKRLWRWNGSWKWTFSGRGCKGQNARSGWGVPAWFEWGQTPLFRRVPKLKWFSNSIFKKKYNIINLSDLAKLEEKWITEVNKETLLKHSLISNKNIWVKVLWKWEVKSKFTLVVDKISASAKESIEKAWGKVEII